ncbi:MAG TPA: VIT domain-containing protein [Chthoniobacteraceae bacterium]|nr:VIT domain-containing protein [Chthoniobacteraceae bacterium]
MSTKSSSPSRMFFAPASRWLSIAALAIFANLATAPLALSQQSGKSAIAIPPPLIPKMVLPRMPEPLIPAKLTQMDVSAHIVGLNAEVTTTMTFLNPNHRVLEGDLEFPLPDGAGVTGYALDIHGTLVDGVVVKKEKARIAFETEVKRGVDPGLVEQVAANMFRTRVYPLPANGTRQVRVRYVTPLSVDAKGDAAWHLPMPVGETIGKLAIDVEVSQGVVKPEIGGFGNLRFETLDSNWVAKTEINDAKPGEDLWVALPKLPAQVPSVEKTKDGDVYFSISDLAPVDAAPEAKAPAHIGLAWDASGSREGEKSIGKETAMLKKLLAAWPDTGVTLVVFRDRAEEPRVFEAKDRDSLFKALAELAYDGGTDLSVVPEAMNKIENIDQWLLFTDGVDTLSGRLPEFGKQRITAVVNETVADRELLDEICAQGGGEVVDLQNLDTDAAVAAITHPPLRLTAVHGNGIADVQGVGQSVHGRAAISGKLTADDAELTFEYSNGKQSQPVKIAKSGATEGNLLATVWAGKRIRQLAARADDNEDELLALGQKFSIVSPVTSLIVLETLDQYVRNEIEPPASLPGLREQWAATMQTKAKPLAKTRQDKLDYVLSLWNARLQWWNTDFSGAAREQAKEPRKYINRELVNGGDFSSGSSSGNASGGFTPVTPTTPTAMPGAPPAPAAMPELVRAEAAADHASVDQVKRLDATGEGGNGESGDGDQFMSRGGAYEGKDAVSSGNGTLTISIKAWDPNTPYLAAIKVADKGDRYAAYLKQRKEYAASPAFFLDCADYFFKEDNKPIATRILTNLAEMKLEDPPLLRVLAWRFQQEGELDRAIVVLRRVYKMRPDEAQSLRDLALALTERGKTAAAEAGKTADLTEALSLEEKLVFGNWNRQDEIELPTLEEMNALIAWIHAQKWDKTPVIPNLDERLLKNMDDDVRIVMSWDADSTDIDLHVVEPTGEEVFYNHNRSLSGGLISHDVTQGYGPEEYIMRCAMPGDYKIFAQYYGSTQQNVTGAVTVTATVFTNFGRPDQKKQVLTLRLDSIKENVPIGNIRFDAGMIHPMGNAAGGHPGVTRDDFRALKAGQTQQETLNQLGEPTEKKDNLWTYKIEKRSYQVKFASNGTIQSVVESLPGDTKMILVQ